MKADYLIESKDIIILFEGILWVIGMSLLLFLLLAVAVWLFRIGICKSTVLENNPDRLVDVQKAGLIELIGNNVVLICMNYIYTGKLTGVNDSCVELENPSIVYETGAWSNDTWDDVQSLCVDKCCVQLCAIEAFAGVDK